MIHDFTTGTRANLSNHPANENRPTWSPDGQRLAFWSDRDGNLEIYVKDLQTGELVNVSQHAGTDSSPVWSPDGQRIAFVTVQQDNVVNQEVMMVDLITGQQMNLSHHRLAHDLGPVWAPHQG